MKYSLVLLDANVIIDAFKHGFWKSLTAQYDIHVTSIIGSEVTFFEDKDGNKVTIDLKTEIASGTIFEVSATAQQIADLISKVNPNLLERIDDGEQEAIALLLSGNFSKFKFCTGDTRAIKALASLNLGAYGVSLEELLKEIGQQKKLPNPSYSKNAFDRKKAEGLQEQSMFLKK